MCLFGFWCRDNNNRIWGEHMANKMPQVAFKAMALLLFDSLLILLSLCAGVLYLAIVLLCST